MKKILRRERKRRSSMARTLSIQSGSSCFKGDMSVYASVVAAGAEMAETEDAATGHTVSAASSTSATQ